MVNSASPPHPAFGPDPHDRSPLELLRANLRAVPLLAQVLFNPRLPAAALRRLVTARLRALVKHAERKVPYYRARFRELGVDHRDIRRVENVARLPLLDKAIMRDHAAELFMEAADRSKLLKRCSSGSSGIPVAIYFDPIAELPRRVQELRFLTAHGYRPWERQLIFDAMAHQAPKRFWPQRLGLWRRHAFPGWLDADAALRYVNRLHPQIIHGVLTELKMVALTLGEGLTFRPRLIVTKGELLDAATRRSIEAAFGGRVVDYYATEETGIIAWQCPTGAGYHVDQDLVLLEIVDEQGLPVRSGERGEIVVTNLYQRAMPMIRFRTGDLGTLSPHPCACGRGLPLLQGLYGRKLDCIITAAGELHEPFRVIAALEQIPQLRQYRVTQLQLDALRVEVLWEHDVGDAKARNAERIVQTLRSVLDVPDMSVEVVEVASFPRPYAGKFQVVKGLPPAALEQARSRSDFRIRMLDL